MPPASPDVQTQATRLERLEGLRGMAWAYAVCHYMEAKPSTLSLKYSAPDSSLGRDDGPKRSSNLMHRYISGKGAPKRGARGKFGFDLVGTISADPRGALAEPSLDLRVFKMLHPDTSLQELRALLFELPEVVRPGLFAPALLCEHKHVAWRRHSLDEWVLPPEIAFQVTKAISMILDPGQPRSPLFFGLFETLVGLWAEARIMCDGERMEALLSLITKSHYLAFADETFPYIWWPFLAFLSFDGPDRPARATGLA